MAAKYQLITELYRRTEIAVAKNPQTWQNFLAAACRNYKCRFDEQLLIFAQRPDAVAVAQLETWNKQFRRWVNKDSKGIAVFDPKGRRNTLKYYFDVSDTHEGYYGSRPVPIWQMETRYEQPVMERLSDRFGELESTDLASALMETAKNAVEDHLQDYLSQLKDVTADSFLEELDDLNIEVMYQRLAVNSVAFMLVSRCGLDTGEYFDREDFQDIVNFNTPATINALGIATSDIAEMALREISQTIRDVQVAEKTQSRTFAQETQSSYDRSRKQPERSDNHGEHHIYPSGGLSYSRPDITDRARTSAWQIRIDAPGLSGAAQESDLSQPSDTGQAERASVPDGTDSAPEAGASDEAAVSRAGRDGGTERESTDAVGGNDEQHSQSGGGADPERADLPLSTANEEEVTANLPTVEEQIEQIAEAEDEKSSAFSVSQEDIDSVLVRGSGFENGKYRIYRQFQKHEDKKANIAFLKNEYGTGGGTHSYPDGTQGGTWHDSKGIGIEKHGSYTNPDLVLSWSKVEKRIRELIQNDRYFNAKEKDHYPEFLESVEAPQYEIDAQRKMARQRFIDAHRDLPPADKRDTLSLRLSDFIRDLDHYEKDLLKEVDRVDLADVSAEQMEQLLSEPATVQQLLDFLTKVQRQTVSVYSRSNAWRFSQELLELHPVRYLYHEGDMVYLGADKYEVSAFDETAVSLQNPEFPLFGKEMSRTDFEEKLRENPANDHLKVIITEMQDKETPAETKPDRLVFSIGFSEHPAFYDRELKDRYTDLSFALGNYLLGVLDEKQHREKQAEENHVGWYHKTDFEITATIGGEDFHYEGRFDIGDGEGDLIAHIKNFYEYSLSPNCPFIPEWKKQGEDFYREKIESLQWGRDVFLPYLEQHKTLTPEDEKLFAEIMATENDWFRVPEDKNTSLAGRLVDFIEEVDPYEYQDTLEVGETKEDAIQKIEADLADPAHVQSYVEQLTQWQEELEDEEQKEICRQLIAELQPTAEQEEKEQDGVSQDSSDLIGKEIVIDNRRYRIESVGEISGDVSMRDITFQNHVGFPINRVEKISYIRRLLEQPQPELSPEEHTDKSAVPSSDRHNYRITEDTLGVGGAKEKFRNNMAAIHLLHELELENRLATPEEQEVLARYVGWGGLSMAFDENNAAWAEEFKELNASLSPEEYRAAMESTLTAFYTPPVVIKAMYEALDHMGFSGGTILEPSCGTGNFFGLIPDGMAGSTLHGVEIDSLTGRIAKQLYQKASIAIEGFEQTKLPDDHFDVVVGNVPFGDFKVNDSRYNAQKFLIHDYFFAKALDKVRSGGVVAFITSKG
ncbi:MAG TPA: N-6 DNA methylase, partial [Candidatus Mediterraneibacter faecavium]|nr:N-6 DNA methylase [Candidatus Mediterraneibacter faecavium]